MSTLNSFIFSTLSADAGLSALVGNRIYPLVAADATEPPYIIFSRVATVPAESHEAPSGLDVTTVQFSCFAKKFSTASAIADALRAALEQATPPDGGSIHFTASRDFFEQETRLYDFQLDADFWHQTNQ